jgi:hypothetical protein
VSDAAVFVVFVIGVLSLLSCGRGRRCTPRTERLRRESEPPYRPEPETIALTPYPRLKVSMLSPNFPDIYTERHQR